MITKSTLPLLLLSFFYWPGWLGAQWARVSSGVETHLRAVHFAGDGAGIAAGDNGVVLYSSDGGASWRAVADGFKEDMVGILALSADTLLIAGGDLFSGSIYRTVDRGENWRYVAEAYQLALTPDDVFALSGETILRSIDRGANWKPLLLLFPSTVLLEKLYFPSRRVGYALGNVAGFVTYSAFGYRSQDEGESWAPLLVSDLPNEYAFTAAAMPHPDTCLLFVNRLEGFLPSEISQLFRLSDFRLDNSGVDQNWRFQAETVNAQLPARVNDVYFFDSRLGYAAGADGAIYRTDNGGQDWEREFSGNDPLAAIFMISPTEGVAVGQNGVILRRGASTARSNVETRLQVRLFPNPARDLLFVQTREERPIQFILRDNAGKILRRFEAQGDRALDIGGLPPGLYLLEGRANAGVFHQKIIVQR